LLNFKNYNYSFIKSANNKFSNSEFLNSRFLKDKNNFYKDYVNVTNHMIIIKKKN
jgi:hypothetical protein